MKKPVIATARIRNPSLLLLFSAENKAFILNDVREIHSKEIGMVPKRFEPKNFAKANLKGQSAKRIQSDPKKRAKNDYDSNT